MVKKIRVSLFIHHSTGFYFEKPVANSGASVRVCKPWVHEVNNTICTFFWLVNGAVVIHNDYGIILGKEYALHVLGGGGTRLGLSEAA